MTSLLLAWKNRAQYEGWLVPTTAGISYYSMRILVTVNGSWNYLFLLTAAAESSTKKLLVLLINCKLSGLC